MTSLGLKDKRLATSLCYATILSLRRKDLLLILEEFPREKRHIRKMSLRFIFRRAVLAYAYNEARERAASQNLGSYDFWSTSPWKKHRMGFTSLVENLAASIDGGATASSIDVFSGDDDKRAKATMAAGGASAVPSIDLGAIEAALARVVKKCMREASAAPTDPAVPGRLADQVMAQLSVRLDAAAADVVAKAEAAVERKFNALLHSRGPPAPLPASPSPPSSHAGLRAIQTEELDL